MHIIYFLKSELEPTKMCSCIIVTLLCILDREQGATAAGSVWGTSENLEHPLERKGEWQPLCGSAEKRFRAVDLAT